MGKKGVSTAANSVQWSLVQNEALIQRSAE